MSPFHFARMFKKATGKPPHVYITAHRMEHAKHLLSDSELPLVDVAASVGFQTQGHFTGVFRKYCGVTPRVFRLHCQAGRLQSELNHDAHSPNDSMLGEGDAADMDSAHASRDSRTPAQRPGRRGTDTLHTRTPCT
jgi:AraC-like DNA-binding protein